MNMKKEFWTAHVATVKQEATIGADEFLIQGADID
jgi:hypothetical protein